MAIRSFRQGAMLLAASLLILIMTSIFIRYGTLHILLQRLHQDNNIIAKLVFPGRSQEWLATQAGKNQDNLVINIDWVGKYPFAKEELPKAKKEVPSLINRVLAKRSFVTRIEKKIDAWTNEQLIGRLRMVNLANDYNKYIGWNIPVLGGYNSVVELSDGHLAEFKEELDLTEIIENVAELNEFCRKHDIYFLVAMAPGKICPMDKDISGKMDFAWQNGDKFVAGIESRGIPCLDIRKIMAAGKSAAEFHDLFYRTDHHWKASTGRQAAALVGEWLNKHDGYDMDLSLFAPEKYREELYPAHFLGSRGKKVTLSRAAPDDFILYYPKFSTSFHYEIPSLALVKDGDFSVMYDMAEVAVKDYYGRSPYGAYGYGDKPLTVTNNNFSHDNKRLLVIKNSFGDALVPFLSLGIKELHELDLRHFNGSLKNYILKHRPDTLLLLFNTEQLTDNVNYMSHKDFWDFR